MSKFINFVGAASLCIVTCLPGQAEEAAKEKPTPTPEQESNDGDIDITVLPQGEPVRGIKIPYYGPDGTTVQMLFDAEVARKIDDSHVALDNLHIEANSDDGRKFFVEFPKSLFDIEDRTLSGDEGIVIRREDFEITGEEATFDIKSRNGKITGKVKMIIYNTDALEQ